MIKMTIKRCKNLQNLTSTMTSVPMSKAVFERTDQYFSSLMIFFFTTTCTDTLIKKELFKSYVGDLFTLTKTILLHNPFHMESVVGLKGYGFKLKDCSV